MVAQEIILKSSLSMFKLVRRFKSKAKSSQSIFHCNIYGALRDLVPFVQFKKREKHHGGVLLLPWVFLMFFKLYK